MKKQKKQMILILAMLIIFGAAYAGMRVYNKNQQEQEEQEEEAAKIYVTKEDTADITAFSYQNNEETLTFVNEENVWVFQDDKEIELEQSAVTSMLEQIASLEAEDTVTDPENLSEYGFDEPSNVVTLTTAEGSISLIVGMQNPVTSQYYLTKSGDDTLYLVASSFLSTFGKTLEDLKAPEDNTEKEPTETEENTEI